MSILAGRLAAAEGSYFLQQSKVAVGRLAQKLPPTKTPSPTAVDPTPSPDVLPEILRHSIPIHGVSPPSDSSLSGSVKWVLRGENGRVKKNVANPLSAFVRMPQATFGPKRWQLPDEHHTFSASTANELRTDRVPADPEKLKALAVGYLQLVKAFAVATTIVFGGSTLVFAYTARKLQMTSTDDIRDRGRDLIQPGVDKMQEKFAPLRDWAENISKRWRIEGGNAQEKSIVKELARTFRARTSN